MSCAGLIQGVVLVTFPAASIVFTSASGFGPSRTEYGGMFVPQGITANRRGPAGLARRLTSHQLKAVLVRMAERLVLPAAAASERD